MAALTENRPTREITPDNEFNDPVAAGVTIYKGALVGTDASGNLRPMVKGTTLTVRGVAREHVDNSDGAAGDVYCQSRAGVFEFLNDGTHPVTAAVKGQVVYAEDDQTVAINATGDRNQAGRLESIDSVLSRVRVRVGYAQSADGDLLAANNLNDVGDAATARANIDANVAYLTFEGLALDAAGVFYCALPDACTIAEIRTVVQGATTANGAATITAALNTTDITDGDVTIADGAVVGEVDSATPSAANVASADDVLRLTVAPNSQDAAASATVTVKVEY